MYLSYPISSRTPMFPGNSGPTVRSASSISRGDPANSLELTVINHSGTHMDFPRHFWNSGRSLSDFGPDDLMFRSPRLVDLPKHSGELITADDLLAVADVLMQADLLVIRTGYAAATRWSDPDRYASHSPGFHSDAADVLVDERYPLRAVMLDTISAACPQHIDQGLEFHRRALGATGSPKQILLIEDVYLPGGLTNADLGSIVVAPLLIEDADGSPCTIVAGL